jgi:hypothetical protein
MGIKTIVVCDICEKELDEGDVGLWFYLQKRFVTEPLVEENDNYKCVCMECCNFIKDNLE